MLPPAPPPPRPAFHLAFAAGDLDLARAFYGGVLGAEMRASGPGWQDMELMGHALCAHAVPPGAAPVPPGMATPVPHFGLVLAIDDWRAMVARLREAGVGFERGPERQGGEAGDDGAAVVLFRDPAGNTLELKGIGP